MASSAASPPRRHRKRISVARLSSDTTSSLPAYSLSPYARSTPNFGNFGTAARGEEEFGDDPPSYEADDDSSEDDVRRRVPLSPPPPLHRRRNSRALAPLRPSPRLPPSHRSRPSASSMSPLALSPSRVRSRPASPGGSESESNDPNLDDLLARSIQALEVSNALLRSSMNTQSSLAAIAANDSPPHSAPPRETPQLPVPEHRTLPTVIHNSKPALDLDMDGISQSLPGAAGPSPLHQRLRSSHKRFRSSSSTDLRLKTDTGEAKDSPSAGNLEFGVAGRSRFVSPAPRALTQYIDFDPRKNPDDATVELPSTLGLRATGSTHNLSAAQSPTEEGANDLPDARIDGLPNTSSPPKKSYIFRPGRAAPLPPPVQAREAPRLPEPPPTPSASSLLSSFLARRPSASAAGKGARSPPRPTKRRASIETASAEVPRPISYHYDPTQTQLPHRAPASLSSTPSSSTTVLRPSRSPTPTRGNRAAPPTPLLLPTRAMTPPIEVSSPSPDSEDYSRSSSDIPNPVLSVQALRRIMADQPPPPPRGLQPRTRAVPTVGTSHATASISRLFTRGTHMHAGSEDARAARRSVLKKAGINGSVPPSPSLAGSEQGSQPPTQPPTPSASFLGLHLPFGGSASSSGRSTPNGTRVSFAALPDDTTGNGSKSSRTRSRSRSRTRRKGKGLARRDSGEIDGGAEGWWAAWLLGGPSAFGEVPVASSVVRERKPYGRSYHGMEDFAV